MCLGRRAFLSGAVLAAALLFAQDPAPAAGNDDELAALRERIAQVQRSLEEARDQRDEVREALRDVEREIGVALAGIRETERAMREGAREPERLHQRQREQEAQAAAQRREIAAHARLAYARGGQETLKLVLNQEDPAHAGRMLAYHIYFARSRADRVASLDRAVRDLAVVESQLAARRNALASLRERQLRETRRLEQSRARERSLLAQLGRRIESRAQQMRRLRADEARLTRLVEDVRQSLKQAPGLVPSGGRFIEARGRLPLPVSTRAVSARKTDLKWKGLLLQARPGQEVRSVFPGRVVYADWLQGIGLLLIVEHGEGYMTLYGHAQSLYKKVGDWVEAGEVIGQTGKTGSFPDPGLYFEIRHNGEPRNPLEWCRRAS